jgi:hypothetical protein
LPLKFGQQTFQCFEVVTVDDTVIMAVSCEL